MFFNRDEARATAASSALSRILQGVVELPSKAKLGAAAVDATLNNLQQAAEDLEESQMYSNQQVLDGQVGGDVKFDSKVWKEGTVRTGAFGWQGQIEPGVEEEEVFERGGGSRGYKEADEDEVEVMTKARGTSLSSSKQGVDADDGVVTVKTDGEAGKEGMLLPHGIRGMENFGKWSPRWNRREDFGIKEGIEEFTGRGILNLGI